MKILSKLSLPADHPYLVNKYTYWYYYIISFASSRVLQILYTEKHHIIPDCFFIENRSKGRNPGWIVGSANDKTNIVSLTAREHFICHWLLTKMINGKPKYQMEQALSKFSQQSKCQKRNFTSLEYQRIRIAASISKVGNKHSDLTKEKIGKAHKGKVVNKDTIAKQLESRRLNGNWYPSESTKQKLRGRPSPLKGKTMDQLYKNKCSEVQKIRFKNPLQKQILIENLKKGRNTVKENGYKLVVKDINGAIFIFQTVNDYAKILGIKPRNIYHLATKYNGIPVKTGRHAGYTFQLIRPEDLNIFLSGDLTVIRLSSQPR